MSEYQGRIILLSGELENGKTTLCLKLLEAAQASGYSAKGVICPPIYENEIKTGIDVLNVESREQRHLAILRGSAIDGIYTTRWLFDQESINWGNEILLKAVPCDLLFVDELGPLEFERGEGWQNGLKAIDSRAYVLTIVVIRPRLIETALQRWPDARVITLTRENREEILTQLINELQTTQNK